MRNALLVLILLLGASAPALAGPPTQAELNAARRRLIEPVYGFPELRSRLLGAGTVTSGLGCGHAFWGSALTRDPAQGKEHPSTRYQVALSRLADLDPDRKLLGPDEWKQLTSRLSHSDFQARNAAERIEFALRDPARQLAEARALEEKVRGKLATILGQALKRKQPTPEALAKVSEGLSKKFSFFENPFRVELLIADSQGHVPALRRWDFRNPAVRVDAPPPRLPHRIDRAVRDLGRRAFAHANVLFASHLYEDGIVLVDAMRAAGMDPQNARFVTTPYPSNPGVMAKMEARGIRVAHAPYDTEKTAQAVEKAVGELLQRSRENHAPILVFDDGGIATSVIAEKFAGELHRFRIVEITKAGERIAKSLLPNKLGVNMQDFRALDDGQLAAVRKRFIEARGHDAESRSRAAAQWTFLYGKLSLLRRPSTQLTLPASSFGFAHYTYSDSRYKREVMTPRYTHAVNRAFFETIGREGLKPINNRVTIIGGGAMGLNAGLELREKKHEVTFVETNPIQRELLEKQHHFTVEALKPALKGRGAVMDLSGKHNLITAEHLFLLADGAHVFHGSSKDNPFDMTTIKGLASEVIPWKSSGTGQRSATYVFEAAGLRRTLHFPGDGFTISHRGEAQNVPLKKFLPEIEALLRLGAHALHNNPVTHYPFFGTPDGIIGKGKQRNMLRQLSYDLEKTPQRKDGQW